MFAQVLQNSVYSFSAILVTFLLSLSLGSMVANRLSGTRANPSVVLAVLLTVAGGTVAVSPWVFHQATDGLSYLADRAAWGHYVTSVFATASAVMLVPAVLMGTVFPYLLRVEQEQEVPVGRIIGRLVSVNALGGILGPLVAGFILLEAVGLWASITIIAYVYLILATVVISRAQRVRTAGRALPLAALVVLAVLVRPSGLGIVKLEGGERLRQVWQGSQGVVTVTQQGDNLKLRLDNYYDLGDTRSRLVEEMQAHIPLLIHPNAQSVFFLGLGTGITAGAALEHPVKRVIVTELVPEVISAAAAHFGPYTNNLFRDPRAVIVAEDGRNYLLGTRDMYDVIVGDLFTPWHAGTGSLYTLDHFRTVRSRLRDGGIFAQWLPLYQLSRSEFLIIVRTMAEVFHHVTLWRGDFSPARPIVALIGQSAARPLDDESLARNVRRFLSRTAATDDLMAGLFYAGNLTENSGLFEQYPINTDDHPIVEYDAPMTQRRRAAQRERPFAGVTLARFYERLITSTPPEHDPFLSKLPAHELPYVEAGLMLYKYHLYRELQQEERAQGLLEQLSRIMPGRLGDALNGWAVTP